MNYSCEIGHSNFNVACILFLAWKVCGLGTFFPKNRSGTEDFQDSRVCCCYEWMKIGMKEKFKALKFCDSIHKI